MSRSRRANLIHCKSHKMSLVRWDLLARMKLLFGPSRAKTAMCIHMAMLHLATVGKHEGI
jgi:hypothetical protein